MGKYSTLDPIAALASPWGESAIAIIRTSGKKCILLVEKLFKGKTPLHSITANTIRHGFIVVPDSGEKIDEVLVVIYKAPKSYTGEDVAEILCHGSVSIVRRILSLLRELGFRDASPGEFTMRAFLNKKMDLTRAEAVNEIVRARTDRGRAEALNRLSGAIEERINLLKRKLLTILAKVEVVLDYPDDEIDDDMRCDSEVAEVETMLQNLLSSYSTGKIIQEGVTLVIAGSTNAGKSTLFNLFLREDRAIVSDIHGTTRDYIEGFISMDGVPIRIFDTAGIRATENPLEIEGMKRTDKIVKNAQGIIYVVDANHGLSIEDEIFINSIKAKSRLILVWNKIDKSRNECPENFIAVSAKHGKGLDLLYQAIRENLLGVSNAEAGEPVIDSYRQKELLDRSLRAIKDFRKGQKDKLPLDVTAICLNDALNALGEITGDVTSQDVLESVFSQFCVGK
jgi:tRNA modification GTPase